LQNFFDELNELILDLKRHLQIELDYFSDYQAGEYLGESNSSINVNDQDLVNKEMKNFYEDIAQLNCQHRSVCKADHQLSPYKFGAYNEGRNDLFSSFRIRRHFLKICKLITMIVERLKLFKVPSDGGRCLNNVRR